MEPEESRSTRQRITERARILIPNRSTIGSLVLGQLLAIVFYTQSALAQAEGIEAAASEICIDRVASLASLGYYALAFACVLKGLYIIESPSDEDQSRKEQRSGRMRGVTYIGIGVLASVIPVILAAAGIVDVTSCVAPEHVGS